LLIFQLRQTVLMAFIWALLEFYSQLLHFRRLLAHFHLQIIIFKTTLTVLASLSDMSSRIALVWTQTIYRVWWWWKWWIIFALTFALISSITCSGYLLCQLYNISLDLYSILYETWIWNLSWSYLRWPILTLHYDPRRIVST